jgi:proteasome accessory factor B
MPEHTSLVRCILILSRLANRGRITVEELHRYFDGKVSRRTLQRDLVRLSEANVPLVSEPGEGRELIWSIEPHYLKFIPLNLGLDEFFSLKILQCASELFNGSPIGMDLEEAIQKIKQLVPADVLESSDAMDAEGAFLGVHRYGYIDYRHCGQQLRDFLWAAVHCNVCQVEYRKPGDEQPNAYEIHPYTLLHHKGAFYGIVYQPWHKSFIYLLIHRIQKLEPTSARFVRDPQFNLKTFLQGAFGIFRETPEEVTIEFIPPVSNTIRERIWHMSQRLDEQKDGSVILRMTVAVNPELMAWILYWGRYARVLGPESLVHAIADSLNSSLEYYSSKAGVY